MSLIWAEWENTVWSGSKAARQKGMWGIWDTFLRILSLVNREIYGQVLGVVVDDDDDLQWVRAPKFPMNLGLIDRSFVSYILISAQDSPVPLPKLRWPPDFKY
jgi:hypothetical protein